MLLAQIGGIVLMFMAGYETDIERMKEAGVTAFLVALSGVTSGASPRTRLSRMGIRV